MLNTPMQRYQQSSVQTATPGQLVIMLYEGAIRFTKLGIDGIDTRRYDRASLNFLKAQAVIHELTAALDHNYPIAKNLGRIYEYMIYQLIQSNLKKQTSSAREVLGHLESLLEAWREASKIVQSGKQGNPA